MSLVKKLKDVLESDDERTYRYVCGRCGTAFSTSADTQRDAQCPECNAEAVLSGPVENN